MKLLLLLFLSIPVWSQTNTYTIYSDQTAISPDRYLNKEILPLCNEDNVGLSYRSYSSSFTSEFKCTKTYPKVQYDWVKQPMEDKEAQDKIALTNRLLELEGSNKILWIMVESLSGILVDLNKKIDGLKKQEGWKFNSTDPGIIWMGGDGDTFISTPTYGKKDAKKK